MGCGKSSVGRRLAELLCCRFMDLDSVIEEREGRKIPEIFASSGEAEFRRMEKEALEDMLETSGTKRPQEHILDHTIQSCKETQTVLALGGGAVMQTECEEMVHSGTLCIYLRASVETLVGRLTEEAAGRPLLAGADPGRSSEPSVMSSEVETSALRSRILELMSQRTTTYERVAHLIVDTDGKTIDEIAEEIISHPTISKSLQKNSPILP